MGLRPATPSRGYRGPRPRPRPADLDLARHADGGPLAAAPLPLPVCTTTPTAIVNGAESAQPPAREDGIPARSPIQALTPPGRQRHRIPRQSGREGAAV